MLPLAPKRTALFGVIPYSFAEVNQHFRRKHFNLSLGSIPNLARSQQKQATGHLHLFVYCLASRPPGWMGFASLIYQAFSELYVIETQKDILYLLFISVLI
jgi:hypothetical protein